MIIIKEQFIFPQENFRQRLLKNFRHGFKLTMLIGVPEERLLLAWWQLPFLSVVSVAIPFSWAFLRVGFSGEFQWESLPSALFHIPLLWCAAILTAYAVGRSEKSLLLMQAFMMISVAIDLMLLPFWTLLDMVPSLRWGRRLGMFLFYFPLAWMAMACAVSALRLAPFTIRRCLLTSIICAVAIAYPLSNVYRERGLWNERYDAEAQSLYFDNMPLATEQAFYEQPKILERELAAVTPGRKGMTNVYFIGVAGYASQDVFMKEVIAVARLFRERFGATGHTIQLINNPNSITHSPIASLTSLRAALKRVGEMMDKDNDVLFLFLTSHGSKTHRLSFEFAPLQLNELDPIWLRVLLDESDITYRVIVVSACYSGEFANVLKDTHTLVITASDANKTSFGCSSSADWTYFGKAYFDDALRKTFSFTDAFNIAKRAVTERENEEGFTPSDPQMKMGRDMRDKLTDLEYQFWESAEKSGRGR
ncbi:MAG: C13 family peptidase [Pseudomonadota bacterium]